MPKSLSLSNNEACNACQKGVAGEGFRCTECAKLSHLSCTGLPTYALACMLITVRTYMCHECVARKKSANMIYEDAHNKIEHLLSSEAAAAGLVAALGDGPVAVGSLSGSGGDPETTASGQSDVPSGPEGELNGVDVRDLGAGSGSGPSRRTMNAGEADTQVRNQSEGGVTNWNSQTRPSKRKICQNYLKKSFRHESLEGWEVCVILNIQNSAINS